MNTLKLRFFAIPLRLRSLDIFFINELLAFLAGFGKLRTSKFVIHLDDVLAEKRVVMNQKTEGFIKEHFAG